MNLHQIVRSAISSVNPDQTIIIKKYIGMDNSGTYAVPQYAEPVEAIAQVQPLTSDDIKFLNSFNQSSLMKAMYINGDWSGLDRVDESGGDIIVWNNKSWYVTSVPEGFSPTAGWTKVIVTAQVD